MNASKGIGLTIYHMQLHSTLIFHITRPTFHKTFSQSSPVAKVPRRCGTAGVALNFSEIKLPRGVCLYTLAAGAILIFLRKLRAAGEAPEHKYEWSVSLVCEVWRSVSGGILELGRRLQVLFRS